MDDKTREGLEKRMDELPRKYAETFTLPESTAFSNSRPDIPQ